TTSEFHSIHDVLTRTYFECVTQPEISELLRHQNSLSKKLGLRASASIFGTAAGSMPAIVCAILRSLSTDSCPSPFLAARKSSSFCVGVRVSASPSAALPTRLAPL